MKKRSIIIYCLLLCMSSIYAQKIQFNINAGGSFLPENTRNFERASTTATWLTINDSLGIRTNYNAIQTLASLNKSNPSFYVNGQVRFKISNRFGINTGWGLESLQFNNTNETIDFERLDVIGQDTLSSIFGTNTFFNPCDSYTNNFSDVETSFNGTNINIVYLKIPLEISYEVIPNFISVKTGLSLSAPIYTQTKNSYISLERNEVNGHTECTYYALEATDNSGISINKMLLGVNLTAACKLTPRISFEVGVSRTFNNVFRQGENLFNVGFFDPLRLTAGVNYTLNYDSSED